MSITQQRLQSIVDYSPETGVLLWRKTKGSRARAGDALGSRDAHGYLTVRIDGESYKVHRLVWIWVTGSEPPEWIDHINGDRLDNRFCNLRLATRSQNQQNRPKNKNNTSGFKGVSYHKGIGRWRATISANGRKAHIGWYDNPEDAGTAYLQASRLMHGEFSVFAARRQHLAGV